MGQNLTPNAVLEWGDDSTPLRIIFRVCREEKLNIQRQAKTIPANLDVFFLEDVEERYLDAGLKVRQLIDDEKATMRPGNQTIVDDARVAIGSLSVAALMGSMSPMRSATDTSGVASFSM